MAGLMGEVPSIRGARRRAESALGQLVEGLKSGSLLYATTGNELGIVEVPDSAVQVYVRLGGDVSKVVKAYWEIANPQPNISVLVEEVGGEYFVRKIAEGVGKSTSRGAIAKLPLPYGPPVSTVQELANRDEVSEIDSPAKSRTIARIPPTPSRREIFRPALHSNSHNWGGADPVMVSLAQLLDFKLSPTAPPTMQVLVHGGLIYDHLTGRLFEAKLQYYQCSSPEEGYRRDYIFMVDRQDGGRLVTVWEDKEESRRRSIEIGISARYYPIALVSIYSNDSFIDWSHITDIRALSFSGAATVLPHPLSPSDGIHYTDSTIPDECVSSHQADEAEKNSTLAPDGLATTLAEEIEQLRYVLEQITGEGHWYNSPVTNFLELTQYIENLDLGIVGHWNFNEGNLSLPVPSELPETPTLGELVLYQGQIYFWDGESWQNLSQGDGKIQLSDDDSCPDYLEEKLRPGKGIRAYFGPESETIGYEPDTCEKLFLRAPASHIHVFQESYIAQCDGVKKEFLTLNVFEPTSLQLFLNGSFLYEGIDYEVGSWYDSFSLVSPPQKGDKLVSNYLAQLV